MADKIVNSSPFFTRICSIFTLRGKRRQARGKESQLAQRSGLQAERTATPSVYKRVTATYMASNGHKHALRVSISFDWQRWMHVCKRTGETVCGSGEQRRERQNPRHVAEGFMRNVICCDVAERQGFEPWLRYQRKHDFQSCAFSHSAISPSALL